jgi:hypothetical protein
MVARPSVVLVLAGALASLGASYHTRNFVVEASTPQIAQRVGEYAEIYRRQKAVEWLGHEMPDWREPCPLRVTVTMNGSGGATSFGFDGRGGIMSQDMHIEGTLERLLASVLPHEVTHTVFAYYFRCPLPRWADEGGSVLSEDDIERGRHDIMVRQILNTPGRSIRLRVLFSLSNYPRDVMVLYAEGYSVTSFLVDRRGRATFLSFVAYGMRGNWDDAVSRYYGFRNVEELEQAWLQHLRDARQPALLAGGHGRPEADPTRRLVVRQTLPPAPPLLEAPRPIYRGQAPAPEPGERPDPRSAARPGFLPDYPSAADQPPPLPPSPVRLGAPQLDSAPPPTQLGQPLPGNSSPAGYSP